MDYFKTYIGKKNTVISFKYSKNIENNEKSFHKMVRNVIRESGHKDYVL